MLSLIHILLLHDKGSSNPLGFCNISDYIPFLPYYGVKDIFSFILVLIVFVSIVILVPDLLGHADILY